MRGLSPESKYFRFMDTLRELTPAMLARFTQIDYDREMAFIAVVPVEAAKDGKAGARAEREIGVCRYVTNPDGETCEFALAVLDAWQRRGLGQRLMNVLIEVARTRASSKWSGTCLRTIRPCWRWFGAWASRSCPAARMSTRGTSS